MCLLEHARILAHKSCCVQRVQLRACSLQHNSLARSLARSIVLAHLSAQNDTKSGGEIIRLARDESNERAPKRSATGLSFAQVFECVLCLSLSLSLPLISLQAGRSNAV